jgi:hypothetical protein
LVSQSRQSKDDSAAVIVGASTSFPDDVNVQVGAFGLMMTTIQGPADQVPFVEAGAIEALADALSRHRLDAGVVRAVCRALGALVFGSIPNQERAAALGLIEAVTGILGDHAVTDEAVREGAISMLSGRSAPPALVAVRACEAIAALVCENPANQERAGAAGACEAVVKTLQVPWVISFLSQMIRSILLFLPLSHICPPWYVSRLAGSSPG